MDDLDLVLVAPDEDTQRTLGKIARRRGIGLTVVPDEAGLAARLAQRPVSLIVLDLDSPDVDGMRLTQRLADGHCDAPVLLASGCDPRTLGAAQRVAMQRGLVVGRSLSKPLQESRVARAVLDALRVQDPVLTAADLEQGLERGELVLYYQPLVDLRTGAVRSVEALLRWHHPEQGSIDPAWVIALAESAGQLGNLTRWVARTALSQCRRWADLGRHFQVAINASGSVLIDPDFADDMAAIAAEAGVPTASLVLEITESEAVTERVEVLETVTRLRLLGVELAIDDFGTGHSSLGRLHKMPFSELKIDKSFVLDMLDAAEGEDAAVIVRAIANLGRDLGLTVVAEGVATREAWDLVTQLGCDLAQGFFVSRPIPADDLTAWLQRWDVGAGGADEAAPAADSRRTTRKRRKPTAGVARRG